MRKSVLGFVAAAAAIAGAAPAMACGSYGGCAVNHAGYGSYGYAGVAPYERLAVPSGQYAPAPRPHNAQYFHVNQGPTYSGPGDFAPYPTYQETAVRGWTGYERGYDYPYDGGPYGNAINHFSDVAPVWHGPMIQTYRWHRGHSYRPRVQSFGIRPGVRTGHAARMSGYRIAGPGVMYAPGFSAARHQYQRPPRRAY